MEQKNLLTSISNIFDYADPRVEKYFLMGSPLPVIAILLFYITFVFRIGPAIMKDRKPMELSSLMMVYNWIQIALNALVVVEASLILPHASLYCTPVNYTNSKLAIKNIDLHYIYAVLKMLDLMDTVFFVLRKKKNQITFLHVYHHLLMVCLSWTLLKFLPGGHVIFLGVINAFVHVVMYFYYFLTSWDSAYKQSIWWKKHLTQLQIVQHCIIFISFVLPLLNDKCVYPKPALCLFITQAILMIYLFTKFYIKAYLQSDSNSKKSKTN